MYSITVLRFLFKAILGTFSNALKTGLILLIFFPFAIFFATSKFIHALQKKCINKYYRAISAPVFRMSTFTYTRKKNGFFHLYRKANLKFRR